MEITIYSSNSKEKFTTSINEGSKWKFELMKEDYITLKFSLEKPVYFKLGDWCDTDFGRFELVDNYRPTYNTATGGYDYELRLDAEYYKWKNKIFKYRPEVGGQESSWNITTFLNVVMDIFLENLNALNLRYHRETEYVYIIEDDTYLQEAKALSFGSTNLIDALTSIAEEWDAEWWIVGNEIHLGRCEHGEVVDFEEGVNVEKMENSESSTSYATRLYVFGGTTNIPAKYRKDLLFTVDSIKKGSNGVLKIKDSSRPLTVDMFSNNSVMKKTINAASDWKGNTSDTYNYYRHGQEGFIVLESNILKGFHTFDMSKSLIQIKSNLVNGYNNIRCTVKSAIFSTIDNKIERVAISTTETVIEGKVGTEKILSVSIPDIDYRSDLYSNVSAGCVVKVELLDGTPNGFGWRIKSAGTLIDNTIIATPPITFITGSNKGKTLSNARFQHDSEGIVLTPVVASDNYEWNISKGDMFSLGNIITAKVPVYYFSQEMSTDIIKTGIVEQHLMLPKSWNNGHNWIDADDNLSDEEIVEGVLVLDDVYPKTTCKITEEPIIYKTEIIDEDTNKGTGQYNTYYLINDSSIDLAKDYKLENVDSFSILFLTGNLSGMKFDINLYKKGDSIKNVILADGSKGSILIGSQEFELVANDDYGRTLPDTILCPNKDDEFILQGYDASYFSDLGLIDKAESELLEKGKKYMEKSKQDPNTYTCPLYWEYAQDHHFSVGQKIKLVNPAYFAEGSRISRVIGFEINIDIPYDNPIYTVGESSAYSRLGDIESKLDSVTTNGKTYIGGTSSGTSSSLTIIKTGSSIEATDNNVYSSLMSRDMFILKNEDDTAKGNITFEKDATVNGTAYLIQSIIYGWLRSANYVNGFAGSGWSAWLDEHGISNIEVDKLTVRQAMTVLDLLIEKVRSIGGQLCVSAANGKIKSVEESGDYYSITFDSHTGYSVHDLIRCQTFTKGYLKSYWVEVNTVSSDGTNILVSIEEFSDGVKPEEGDETVLMGNTVNTDRQDMILISSTEDGIPRIDVCSEIKEKSLDNSLRVRLGKLDGIQDSWFPNNKQPKGNGLYANNVYLKGIFLLETGENVKTKFEITEGKIASAVEGFRNDYISNSYLSNPTFADGLMNWSTNSKAFFYEFGDDWLMSDNDILGKKNRTLSFMTEDGRTFVRLVNNSLTQKKMNMNSIPTFDVDENGKVKPMQISLTFTYRVISAGSFVITFNNVDKSISEDFDNFAFRGVLQTTDGFVTKTINGLWNGTGDFYIVFTGQIDLSMMMLTKNEAANIEYKYQTLFEQNERIISATAAIYGENNTLLEKSGIMVKAEGAGIYTQDANGKLATVGTYEDGVVKLTGKEILLEGDVTANGNFHVNSDGTVAMSGYIRRIPIPINDDNIEQYGDYDEYWAGYVLNSKNNFTMYNIAMTNKSILICFNGMNKNLIPSTSKIKSELRSMVGNKVLIYNNGLQNIAVSGCTRLKGNETNTSFTIEQNIHNVAVLECCMGFDSNGYEEIYWEYQLGTQR